MKNISCCYFLPKRLIQILVFIKFPHTIYKTKERFKYDTKTLSDTIWPFCSSLKQSVGGVVASAFAASRFETAEQIKIPGFVSPHLQ